MLFYLKHTLSATPRTVEEVEQPREAPSLRHPKRLYNRTDSFLKQLFTITHGDLSFVFSYDLFNLYLNIFALHFAHPIQAEFIYIIIYYFLLYIKMFDVLSNKVNSL